MKAIIYARFSSREQEKGDSLRRQIQDCTRFCESNQFPIEKIITDEGVSAWTGKNLTTGNLASFTKYIEKNGGQDKVLIVEKLDRITRLHPTKVLSWINRTTDAGLTIMTCDNHVINHAKMTKELMPLMSLVFSTFNGFVESEKKSSWLKSAWEGKRKRARDERKAMTAICPKWLKKDGDTYVVIDERADVVKRMFKMLLHGASRRQIIRALNADNVPTFGKAKGWYRSYLNKILESPAVIGVYQPHTITDGVRKPDGEPISDYFPAIISYTDFKAAQTLSGTYSHSANRGYVNLLSGTSKCAACGNNMTMRTSLKKTGNRWRGLQCDGSQRGLCDKKRNWNYRLVLNQILNSLLHRAMDASSFKNDNQIADLIETKTEAEHKAGILTKQTKNLLELVADGDEMATKLYSVKKAELELAQEALDIASKSLRRASNISPEQHMKNVNEVRSMFDSDDDFERNKARSTIKKALDSIVENILFEDETDNVIVNLKGNLGVLVILVDREAHGTLVEYKNPVVPDGANEALAVAAYQRRSKLLT